MSYINLNPGSCQACYRCVRECPVKAIEFKEDKATIIEKACILCGRCIEVCPQKAKSIASELNQVKAILKEGRPIYASVAPSYKGFFNMDFQTLRTQLISIGFTEVEETAIGASEINKQQLLLMKENPILITSACPSVVHLVERHFPALRKYLVPLVSPMMAHGRLIKEATNGDTVFFGPCISKKSELSDPQSGGFIKNVLGFHELKTLLEDIDAKERLIPDSNRVFQGEARLYPTPGGIISSMKALPIPSDFTYISVDSPEDVISFFKELTALDFEDKLSQDKLFIEANICKGACMGGPVFKINHIDTHIQRNRLKTAVHPNCDLDLYIETDPVLNRSYFDKSIPKIPHSEDLILDVLRQIGKYTPEEELNCGTCGYNTCRDKAEAVLDGKADIHMCLPFFRKKAENLSSTIIENSPNGIVALSRERLVMDINPTAAEIYAVDPLEIIGGIIPELYDDPMFEQAIDTKTLLRKNLSLTILGKEKIIEKTLIYIEEYDSYVAFIKDLTPEELHKRKIHEMRTSTARVTQEVIEKQMRVVQEIASLLGETAAETKLALNKLKETIVED